MSVASALDDAWSKAQRAFAAGRINTERTLQAHLFCSLQSQLPAAVVLCEPQLNIDEYGLAVPDLVVLSGEELVAFVELKFAPHHFPVFEGDLAKLAQYHRCSSSFQISLDPASGKYSERKYSISPSCLFVFAAVGRHDAAAVDREHIRTRPEAQYLAQQFVLLSHPVGADAA